MSDPSSSANFNEVAVNHIELEWQVSFDEKRISGQCTLQLAVFENCENIILDSDALNISKICLNGETSDQWSIDHVAALGQKIVIPCALRKGDKNATLTVHYATSPDAAASALQFIDAATSTDGQPFLYSQCQPILARSLLPCMDTPSVKMTFQAKVQIPHDDEMVCLMSALSTGKHTSDDGLWDQYKFEQPIPIASNLISIVVGVLERQALSDRCAVWAQPHILQRAAWEFADAEQMLQQAELLLGPYRWGRYDVVVMPSFFPYGGMENPCLTFVTPSIISGNKSMMCTIVHEISHSWTGNLVTNCSWEHFWLNEGFTMFLERKLLGKLFGEPVRHFEHLVGWEDNLMDAINITFGGPEHEYTKLIPNLQGSHPDDAFSHIPYEKGSAFLLHIEQTLGSAEEFEAFLREYIKEFAGKSICTEQMKNYLYKFFADKKDLLDSIQWHKWLYGNGIPPAKPIFDDCLALKCKKLAKKCLDAQSFEQLDKLFVLKYVQMAVQQKIKFFNILEKAIKEQPKNANFLVANLGALDRAHGFSIDGTLYLRRAWLYLCLTAEQCWAIQHALELATNFGNFSTGLFKRLFAWTESRPLAIEQFRECAHRMHPANARTIGAWIGDLDKI